MSWKMMTQIFCKSKQTALFLFFIFFFFFLGRCMFNLKYTSLSYLAWKLFKTGIMHLFHVYSVPVITKPVCNGRSQSLL